jgi:hypothetical protein
MLQETFALLLVYVNFFSGSQNQELIFNKQNLLSLAKLHSGDSMFLPVY